MLPVEAYHAWSPFVSSSPVIALRMNGPIWVTSLSMAQINGPILWTNMVLCGSRPMPQNCWTLPPSNGLIVPDPGSTLKEKHRTNLNRNTWHGRCRFQSPPQKRSRHRGLDRDLCTGPACLAASEWEAMTPRFGGAGLVGGP